MKILMVSNRRRPARQGLARMSDGWSASTIAPAALVIATLLTGCETTHPSDALPSGESAYGVFAPPSDAAAMDYRLGPFDELTVTVFQEPDLSVRNIPVDASGNISLPLIGDVRASGKTANELSREIASRFNVRYLRDAQVLVTVTASESQHITIEGNVNSPGVYEISGSQTLLQAIAQAKSPNATAKLDQIVVFRYVEGQRMGAVFDLKAIREGKAEDPALRGGDIVVVGYSAIKGAFRTFLQSAPVIGLFRYF